jgi:hypothetical protein
VLARKDRASSPNAKAPPSASAGNGAPAEAASPTTPSSPATSSAPTTTSAAVSIQTAPSATATKSPAAQGAEPGEEAGSSIADSLNAELFGEGEGLKQSAGAKAAAEAPHATPPPVTKDGAEPNEKFGPAKIEIEDDGSMLVDGKYTIRGKGTKDEPYRITWDLLTSAQETYQPRLGLKHIPDRLNIVNNKWVTIAGYVAFPIMAATPDEMLMMLNQWDGCCIGVPPTPYDAVEVKLSTPATRDQRFAIDGTITGVLRVDPYLVKDWLVSMYLMDDAKIVQDSTSGAQKKVRDPNAHAGKPGGGAAAPAGTPSTPAPPPTTPADAPMVNQP